MSEKNKSIELVIQLINSNMKLLENNLNLIQKNAELIHKNTFYIDKLLSILNYENVK